MVNRSVRILKIFRAAVKRNFYEVADVVFHVKSSAISPQIYTLFQVLMHTKIRTENVINDVLI